MNTELLVKTETDVYKTLDLFDDISIPLVYQIQNYENFGRVSAYSLTVDLPNTENNNQILFFASNINAYDGEMNFLTKYDCRISRDGVHLFNGTLQITSYKVEEEKIIYECKINAAVTTIFDNFKNETLRGNDESINDLDFSSYTFNYNQAFVEPKLITDTTTGGTGVGFGLIDRWKRSSNVSLYSPNNSPYTFFPETQVNPYLCYYEIIQKIFSKTDYTIISDFFETPMFKQIKYPYNGDTTKLNLETAKFEMFDYNYYNLTINDNAWNRIIVGNMQLDYEPATDICIYHNFTIDDTLPLQQLKIYTATDIGLYWVEFDFKYKYYYVLYSLLNQSNQYTSTAYYKYYDSGYPNNFYFQIWKHIAASNTDVLIYTEQETNSFSDGDPISYDAVENAHFVKEQRFKNNNGIMVRMENGDYLWVQFITNIRRMKDDQNNILYIWIDINSNQVRIEQVKNYITNVEPGASCFKVEKCCDWMFGKNNVDPTFILNPKTTKYDFLMNVIKKFNLFIEDVSLKKDLNNNSYYNNKVLRIEPYSTFYRDTFPNNPGVINEIDITEKCDFSDYEIQRIPDFLSKTIEITDKADGTELVKSYNEAHKDNEWGSYNSELFEYLGEETKIETTLGQTACTTMDLLYGIGNITDLNTENSSSELNDRMLFLQNVTLGQNRGICIYKIDYAESYPFNPIIPLNSTTYFHNSSYNTYSNFSSFPSDATSYDLNYDNCESYYEEIDALTNKNCYNLYYYKMFYDLNSKLERMLTINCILHPTDINDFTFDKTYIINQTPYYLYKIDGWENGETLCECQFLKRIYGGYTINPSPTPTPIQQLRFDRSLSAEVLNNKIDETNISIETLSNETLNSIKLINDGISKISTQISTLDKSINDMSSKIADLDGRITILENK